MTTKKIRAQILESFLENLYGISDKEYQQRVWVHGSGPEVDDYDETVCDFFDLGEGIFENHKEYNISDQQYILLSNFRDAFKAFNEGPRPYLEEEFIDSPEWARIIEMAKEVLEAFDYPKS